MNGPTCAAEHRRELVRQHAKLNGLDYVEVGSNRRILTVHFLGKAPVSLDADNIRIDGGRRITGIKVEKATVRRTSSPGLDDTMEVVTDREGDFSPYELRVVERDDQGVERRHRAFDRNYDRVTFSFKVDCPSDLDCGEQPGCPPARRDEPEIDYLARDYTSFRQVILDRLALVMPEWRERHVPDIGIAIAELLAYTGDHLAYYQDSVATEAYLETARQRVSVRRHARLVDYTLHEGCNARTWVSVETDSIVTLDPRDISFVTLIDGLPRVASEDLLRRTVSGYETFEPMGTDPITLYPGHHDIRVYSWADDECCLPAGSTTATLVGTWIEDTPVDDDDCEPPKGRSVGQAQATASEGTPTLHLKVGEVLIFEEVIGPKTSAAADADRTRRHPVRLVRIDHVVDPLYPDRGLTEIEWSAEDALPVPLCLSAMGPPPACEIVQGITVLRGNLVLVDHGRRVTETLDPVPTGSVVESCDCDGNAADPRRIAGRFRPVLKETGVTFSEPLAADLPASRLLVQNPRQTLPHVSLTGAVRPSGTPTHWIARTDLLNSRNPDRHFVVEIEEDGRAYLRFGDDDMGQRPDADAVFDVTYRVGNGTGGNVGAGAIAHLITREHAIHGGVLSVRNPIAARGGTAPEPVAEAKLYAPHAFRSRLERAVTADDYAAIVQREFPSVQRAAASMSWNGSWYQVVVAIDPVGRDEASPALLAEVARRLHRYRRIGHDLHVRSARRVPLDIELGICAAPGHLRAHVKRALLEVFGTGSSADGRLGMFHPDRLTFGDGIYVSTLVAAAQAVVGVESVRVTRLQRLYSSPEGEVENGFLALGPLEVARVDNDPSVPENGRMRLDVRGGR
jgi:hypothetical protein